jgi:hypothetical protein
MAKKIIATRKRVTATRLKVAMKAKGVKLPHGYEVAIRRKAKKKR